MNRVLYIKANAKPEGLSRTFQISDIFIKEYMKIHPEDEIITLDLYKENIDFLTPDDLNALNEPKEGKQEHPVFKYAFQFIKADKYVIAEPLWNLSIPAILKAYIDYITVNGITFEYTESGPVGLCNGKKAVNITSRGGDYSHGNASEYEMGDRYLRTIIGFLGITDFTTISADALDVAGNNIDAILNNAIRKAQDVAKNF